MSNDRSDYALGSWVEWMRCPRTRDSLGTDNIIAALLTSSGLPSAATFKGCQFFSNVFSAGAIEATAATSYARNVYGSAAFSISVNTTTHVTTVAWAANPTWSTLGGASNVAVGKVLLGYRRAPSDADSAISVIGWFDQTGNTNGTNYTPQFSSLIIGTAA